VTVGEVTAGTVQEEVVEEAAEVVLEVEVEAGVEDPVMIPVEVLEGTGVGAQWAVVVAATVVGRAEVFKVQTFGSHVGNWNDFNPLRRTFTLRPLPSFSVPHQTWTTSWLQIK